MNPAQPPSPTPQESPRQATTHYSFTRRDRAMAVPSLVPAPNRRQGVLSLREPMLFAPRSGAFRTT
jgi:hypothetical protein